MLPRFFFITVVDNCTTIIVLNNLDLFDKPLTEVSNIGIVIVVGEDYYPMHVGIANLS